MRRSGAAAFLASVLAVAAGGCATVAAPPPLRAPVPAHDGGESPAADPSARWRRREEVHTTVTGFSWRTTAGGEATVLPGTSYPTGTAEPTGTETMGGGRIEGFMDDVGLAFEVLGASPATEGAGVEGNVRYYSWRLTANMRVHGPDPRDRFDAGLFEPALALDGVAGIRVHAAEAALQHPVFSDATGSASWGEPVFGARASVHLLKRLSAYARGEIGGLWTEAWISRSWDVEAGVQFNVLRNLAVVAGWRETGVSFDDDDPDGVDEFDLELRLRGPWLGIVLEF
jgi:opacity protein-like surface antigen